MVFLLALNFRLIFGRVQPPINAAAGDDGAAMRDVAAPPPPVVLHGGAAAAAVAGNDTAAPAVVGDTEPEARIARLDAVAEEDEGVRPPTGTVATTANGTYAVTAQEQEYKRRGEPFAFHSLTVYACTVTRVRIGGGPGSGGGAPEDGDDAATAGVAEGADAVMQDVPATVPPGGAAADAGVAVAAAADEDAQADPADATAADDVAVEGDGDAAMQDVPATVPPGGAAAGAGGAATRGRGRPSNSVYRFDVRNTADYPLVDTFQQRLSSRITVPLFGGLSAVPCWPGIAAPRMNGAEEDEGCNKFAEWILAVHIPWPAPGHVYPDDNDTAVERLGRIMHQLEQGTFLRAPNGTYHAPPGYNSVMSDADDMAAYAFSQRCLWRHIGDLARGIRRSSDASRKIQAMYRSRCAHHWGVPDPEAAAFPDAYARNNAPAAFGEDGGVGHGAEVIAVTREALVAAGTSLVRMVNEQDDSPTSLVARTRAYIAHLQQLLGVTLSGAPVPVVPRAADLPAVGTEPRLREDAAAGPNEEAALVAALLRVDPPEPPAIPTPPQPLADVAGGGRGGGPATQLLAEMRARAPPLKRPNDGQCVVLEEFARYFDQVFAGATPPPPHIFLDGAGGTGKSFLFACLEELAMACGRPVAPSALTGVACTAIHTLALVRTTASLYKFGITPQDLENLSDAAVLSLLRYLNNAILLIIDEVSFAQPAVISAVNARLQQVMQTDAPFGGACAHVRARVRLFDLPHLCGWFLTCVPNCGALRAGIATVFAGDLYQARACRARAQFLLP